MDNGIEFTVKYTATFTTKVRIKQGDNVNDAISDIVIPENQDNEYLKDSFKVLEMFISN